MASIMQSLAYTHLHFFGLIHQELGQHGDGLPPELHILLGQQVQ